MVAPASVASASSPGLIVVDAATGHQVSAIRIPLVTELFQTGLPDHLIARTGSDLFVVDADAGEATRLDFGAVKPSDLLPNYIQTRGTAGRRFFILGDGSMGAAFAIDLKTGRATDLVKLVRTIPGASAYAGYVAVSSDDQHIVVWDGGHTYLISTDAMTVARLGGSEFTYGPTFTSDGLDLVYSHSLPDNAGSELVAQPLDGSPAHVIQSSARVAITLAVPGSNLLLVDDRSLASPGGSLALLDIETGATTKLIDYAGSVLSVQFTPDGAFAIVGVDGERGRSWTQIDLASGRSRVIAGAAESNALPGLYGNSNWATFIPMDIIGVGTTGGFYGGMNLRTGDFHTFFDIRKNVTYSTPQLATDGRRVLLQAMSGAASDLWLLDNETGESRLLGSSLNTTGQISPDGCWAAVSKSANIDGLRTTILTLVPTTGDDRSMSLSNGRALAWLD